MARILVAVALVSLVALSAPAFAQPVSPAAGDAQPDPTAEDQELDRPLYKIFQDIGSDLWHLPSRQNALWIGGGGLLALAAHPLDDNLSSAPGEEWARWSEIFDPGTYIGNTFVLLAGSGTTYAVGKLTGRPRAAHVGRDLIRAQVVSQIVVQTLKVTVSRERPDQSSDRSFPSGHAATTFASAVVFHRHLGTRWAWPTYAVATYVAFSRMHENKHYLSDVLMGAGLGIASGLATTRHATATWALAPAAVPGGVALTVTRVR